MDVHATHRPIQLLLFTANPELAAESAAAGVHGVVVDLEQRDKASRQQGADTEINADTLEDLARLASVPVAVHLCRINAWGPWSPGEIDDALRHGASHLLLPMVRHPSEVTAALEAIRGRCPLGILVETQEACDAARELARLPLAMVYVGLNDLAIARKAPFIFDAVADGTVAHLHDTFAGTPFGFGGLTVVDGGHPVACRLLIAEMARLDCAFAFLRRSFKRDIRGRDLRAETGRIQSRWSELKKRSPAQVAADHEELLAAIRANSASRTRAGRPTD